MGSRGWDPEDGMKRMAMVEGSSSDTISGYRLTEHVVKNFRVKCRPEHGHSSRAEVGL